MFFYYAAGIVAPYFRWRDRNRRRWLAECRIRDSRDRISEVLSDEGHEIVAGRKACREAGIGPFDPRYPDRTNEILDIDLALFEHPETRRYLEDQQRAK